VELLGVLSSVQAEGAGTETAHLIGSGSRDMEWKASCYHKQACIYAHL